MNRLHGAAFSMADPIPAVRKGNHRLRILLLGLNYAPELTGIGKYSGEMMDWLAARGHEIRVVTSPPYYPSWKVRADYCWWLYRRERAQAGVEIYRCPIWVPQQPSGISRVIHLASFAVSILPVALALVSWRPDVVITVEPTFLTAPVALLTAGLAGSVSWLHVQDFEIDAAFELGILPKRGPIHRMALRAELTVLRRFMRLSTISHNMARRLASKGVDSDKVVLLPNWVDLDAIRPMSGTNRFRKELGVSDDQVVLLYSGNMGLKQGLEILPRLALELAKREDLRFVFCGEGSFRSQLQSMTRGLRNVSLLPLQPAERLNELLNAADIHLLPQSADAADLVMPSKLTGMLASGRAVIATANAGTQLAEILEGCGLTVTPGDIGGLRQAVEILVADRELRTRMGAEARTLAENNLGRDQVLQRFETSMLKLVHTEYSHV
jgi:colanic acid biosynthesis glycosyl transferase WcaI